MLKHEINTVYNSPMGSDHSEYETFYAAYSELSSYEFHNHNFYEIYLHISGGEYIWLDDKLYELTPNCMIIHRPYRMHGVLFHRQKRDYERAFLYITPHLMDKLGMELVPFSKVFSQMGNTPTEIYPLTPEKCANLTRILIEIASRKSSSPIEELKCYSLLTRFLIDAASEMGNTKAIEPIGSDNPVYEALSYINTHFTERLSLEELANRCCMSQSHLSHTFRKLTGRGVYSYVQCCRVTHAKKYIANIVGEKINLSKIAIEYGFTGYSAFIRTFRNETCLTLTEYVAKATSD